MQSILRKELEKYKVDAFYITDPKNIFYLTGFKGSFGAVLVTAEKNILVTDSRYVHEAQTHCHGTEVIDIQNPLWAKLIQSKQSIAFEAQNMIVERIERLQKKYKNTKWIASSPVIEDLRRQKNAFEITAIHKACEIADQALARVLKTIKENDTEIEIAWRLERTARELGAEGLSFPAIVAFEKNSAVPHHESNDTKLKIGDTVLIDFGVKYHNYCSDMTRTYFFKELDPIKETMYYKVLEAQERGKAAIKIHGNVADAYKAAMEYFEEEDLGEYFTHSLGHGVGLNVHESPSISGRSEEFFVEWDTVTCEPGLYFPDNFGIRIEDLGVLKKEGFEYLTQSSKTLTVLK